MAIRDIYETGFDEDVQTESSANQCPECNGHVTTNVKETICEDCGLVIEEQRLDHGPEWRGFDEDDRDRTGAPLTAARHDRGLSTEIGHGTDAHGNELELSKSIRDQACQRFRSAQSEDLLRGRSIEAIGAASIYRRSRPSASGLDPEGDGRKLW